MRPYDEGFEASRLNQSRDSNPYVSESRAWYLWHDGYSACQNQDDAGEG